MRLVLSIYKVLNIYKYKVLNIYKKVRIRAEKEKAVLTAAIVIVCMIFSIANHTALHILYIKCN